MVEDSSKRSGLRGHYKLMIVLVAVALAAVFAGLMFLPIPVADIMDRGDELANNPVAIVAIVVVMAVTMSLGLPGSLCFWLIAPFHPPLIATPLLLAGSLSGAIGAYHLSAWLRHAAPDNRLSRRISAILTRRSDLLTQIALRVLPGFPHALVNFTCGLLRLPRTTFILAAIVGLTSKWAVYSSAVYGARSAFEAEESLDLTTLLPLAILGVLLLISGQLKRTPPDDDQ